MEIQSINSNVNYALIYFSTLTLQGMQNFCLFVLQSICQENASNMFQNTPLQLKQKKSQKLSFLKEQKIGWTKRKSTFKRTSFFKTVYMVSIWLIKLSPFIPCLINFNRIYADTYIVGSETSQWPGLSVVGHNFLKGKEVSLPSSNRSTFLYTEIRTGMPQM